VDLDPAFDENPGVQHFFYYKTRSFTNRDAYTIWLANKAIRPVILAVLRFRIRRVRILLGLLDPDLDPLVSGTDPDPSITKQKIESKTFIPPAL
jgi:hypothetical protein